MFTCLHSLYPNRVTKVVIKLVPLSLKSLLSPINKSDKYYIHDICPCFNLYGQTRAKEDSYLSNRFSCRECIYAKFIYKSSIFGIVLVRILIQNSLCSFIVFNFLVILNVLVKYPKISKYYVIIRTVYIIR